jgi:hypothetical protein
MRTAYIHYITPDELVIEVFMNVNMEERILKDRLRVRTASALQHCFQFTNIYSNTLVHSSPHHPVYCMGRWVRLHCFFQMGILDRIQHFMHEILIVSSQYFTSYCIESRHLCEILKSGHFAAL